MNRWARPVDALGNRLRACSTGARHPGGCRIALLAVLLCMSRTAVADPSYDTYFRAVGERPNGEALLWSRHVQGAAHDADHWYIAQGDGERYKPFPYSATLWRIPVGVDLASLTDWDAVRSAGVTLKDVKDVPELVATGVIHIGDPAYYEYDGEGYVLAPFEQGSKGMGIAVFRANEALDFVTFQWLTKQPDHAAWCAVDPQGNLYSSNDYTQAHKIYKYVPDWAQLRYGTPPQLVGVGDKTGTLGEPTVLDLGELPPAVDGASLQGGEISPDGKLLYLVYFGEGIYWFLDNGMLTYRHDFSGIRVHRLDQGPILPLVTYSYNPEEGWFGGWGWFVFQAAAESRYPIDFPETAEGLTIWDLDDGRAPGIRGQLHVFLATRTLNGVWFKHYDGVIPVNGATGKDEDNGPGSVLKTVHFAHDFAWSGAKLKIAGGSYPEAVTLSKPMIVQAVGGPVTIGP